MKSLVIGASGRLGGAIITAMQSRGDTITTDFSDVNYLVFAHRYRGPDNFDAEMQCHVNETIADIAATQWAQGDRAIVIISSIDAEEPNIKQSLSYNVSKAALNQFVRYYAKLDKVRINAVSPATFTGGDPDVSMAEVANVVAFLCSAESSGIHGQNIKVTGRLCRRSRFEI